MKILGVVWQSPGATADGSIGIVRVLDEYEGIKYYIGIGLGRDADADIKHIANWGGTFHKHLGDLLFKV